MILIVIPFSVLISALLSMQVYRIFNSDSGPAFDFDPGFDLSHLDSSPVLHSSPALNSVLDTALLRILITLLILMFTPTIMSDLDSVLDFELSRSQLSILFLVPFAIWIARRIV
ncbi:hypothetical protein EVAR_63949_1 [Eumeta japonica]|uniref:Uncharacterized protein n=1 Tax=Eumeta variegata TaxID=151549 RepID=A0A4C1ZI39_EUMVA|nr:hypothetical protein EVAR_63949_1 [Eumeta japonica]